MSITLGNTDIDSMETAVGNVTAVFLFSKRPSEELMGALSTIRTTQGWKLVEEKIDVKKANAFRINKIPVLILYNDVGIETARVIGDENIRSTVGKLVSHDG
jgi:hypothetical protein